MEKYASPVFIRQADVAREGSSLLAPGSLGPTASAAVLLYLLTGQDADDLEAEEDPKISAAKKKALIGYIQAKVNELSVRRENWSRHFLLKNHESSHKR